MLVSPLCAWASLQFLINYLAWNLPSQIVPTILYVYSLRFKYIDLIPALWNRFQMWPCSFCESICEMFCCFNVDSVHKVINNTLIYVDKIRINSWSPVKGLVLLWIWFITLQLELGSLEAKPYNWFIFLGATRLEICATLGLNWRTFEIETFDEFMWFSTRMTGK